MENKNYAEIAENLVKQLTRFNDNLEKYHGVISKLLTYAPMIVPFVEDFLKKKAK